MRALSSRAVQALMAAQTGEIFHLLIDINHADLATPKHYVQSALSLVSNGITYEPLAFELPLPNESKTDLATLQLVLDNTEREASLMFRSISILKPCSITCHVVLADTPDIEELDPPLTYQLLSVSLSEDGSRTACELAVNEALNEPFPGYAYSPYTHPGLYGTTYG